MRCLPCQLSDTTANGGTSDSSLNSLYFNSYLCVSLMRRKANLSIIIIMQSLVPT